MQVGRECYPVGFCVMPGPCRDAGGRRGPRSDEHVDNTPVARASLERGLDVRSFPRCSVKGRHSVDRPGLRMQTTTTEFDDAHTLDDHHLPRRPARLPADCPRGGADGTTVARIAHHVHPDRHSRWQPLPAAGVGHRSGDSARRVRRRTECVAKDRHLHLRYRFNHVRRRAPSNVRLHHRAQWEG